MSLRMISLAILAFAITSNAHPIEKVIDLLKKLKDQAIEEGKAEEVSFAKYTYWCKTSISELDDTIKEEKATIDELESTIEGLKETKKSLEDDLKELAEEIKDLQAAAKAAKEKDAKRTKAYVEEKKDLKSTISSIDEAIKAMQDASKTDSMLLQQGAQNSVRQALAFLSMKTNDEQQALLMDFVAGRPDQLAKGDLKQHVKKYSFKSDNVIDLLKELKLKFQDDLTAADVAETDGANQYALEKKARDAAETASKKSESQKKINLGETESALSEAEGNLKDEEADLKADKGTLEKTTSACKTANREWEERSKTRSGEVEAITEASKILAEVSGVRTEAPSNPVPPTSPIDFLQVSMDPKTNAVNLLRTTAKEVHSKALERLALEVSTHLTGPFDKVNDMIQKMVFRLMSEQTDEDKHKAWCDLELDKTKQSKEDKEDKIKGLDASIDSEDAKVAKLKGEIADADKMVADITAFMEEATEIRNAGKGENKIAIKESKEAQTAIANAVAVLEDFYKSSGEVKKEPWEFIQAPGKVTLPKDPKLWKSSYTGVANPKDPKAGVLTLLETCAADFSKMEAETKAQEVQDQKEYDDQMKAHKVEKARRQQESDAKVQERKRKIAKVEQLTTQKKHTNDELDAVKQYSKDLQQPCVEGDSKFEDRKAARAKEIKALKEAQSLLQNAFKEKKAFLQIKRHA